MKSIIILAGLAVAFTPVCIEHKLRSTLDDGFCRRAVEYQKLAGVDYEPGRYDRFQSVHRQQRQCCTYLCPGSQWIQ